MKNATELLSTYKSVHLNHTNLLTHCGGIPLIITAVIVILNTIKIPLGSVGTLPLSVPCIAAVLFYYCFVHWALAVGALLFVLLLYVLASVFNTLPQPLWWAVGLFVAGWLLQFIGHYYERARPAFFDDLKQLLIGPLFLIAELYFLMGFQFVSHTEIEQQARQKRKLLSTSNQIPPQQ